MDIKLFPDIFDYINATNAVEVSTEGLEEMIAYVRAHTGLPLFHATTVVKYYFQGLRDGIVKGEKPPMKNMGWFTTKYPKDNKNHVKIRYRLYYKFKKRIRE